MAFDAVGDKADDIIDPKTGKVGGVFGVSPCLESRWGHDYFRKLYAFFQDEGHR